MEPRMKLALARVVQAMVLGAVMTAINWCAMAVSYFAIRWAVGGKPNSPLVGILFISLGMWLVNTAMFYRRHQRR